MDHTSYTYNYYLLRSTIGERNPNRGWSEIEIFSVVVGWTDTNLAPRRFLQGHNLGQEQVYTLTRFHIQRAVSLLRRSLFRTSEGSSRLEKATFRPRSYCKSLIEVLETYARLLGTYVNLQFAVQLAF